MQRMRKWLSSILNKRQKDWRPSPQRGAKCPDESCGVSNHDTKRGFDCSIDRVDYVLLDTQFSSKFRISGNNQLSTFEPSPCEWPFFRGSNRTSEDLQPVRHGSDVSRPEDESRLPADHLAYPVAVRGEKHGHGVVRDQSFAFDSPPDRVPIAPSTPYGLTPVRPVPTAFRLPTLMPSRMNRTEPSPMRALQPPVWLLLIG
jgi:hypothetical protein